MKVSFFFKIISICFFFNAILLIRLKLGSFSLFHVGLIVFLFFFILFSDKPTFQNFFKVDSIILSLLFFLLIVLISYLVNISYSSKVLETYSFVSGESPSNLYIKIAINGLIFVLSSIFSYSLGRTVASSKEFFLQVYNTLIIFCLMNAIVNVVTWIIVTKASFGRYNFEPPLTFSPGVSIQYSTIGFMFCLALLGSNIVQKRRKWIIISLSFLLLSIMIILTRQAQLSFVIICVWYLFKTQKLSLKSFLIMVPTYVLFLLGALVFLSINDVFASYEILNSTESVDFESRNQMLNSAVNIFLENPYFGVGYGMFVGHNRTFFFVTGVPVFLSSAHNGMASILSELGIFGIIIYLIIVILVILKLSAALKSIKDISIYKYCSAIYVFQFVMILSAFLSNSTLFGPPSEISYLYTSFISWFMIGSVIGIKNVKI